MQPVLRVHAAARLDGFKGVQMSPKPPFPTALDINGRPYFLRSQLEEYKQALIAWASGAQVASSDTKPAIEEFVPAERAARELGVGRRTIGRRIGGRSPATAPNSRRTVAEAV
jgi:hypothetical protein